MPKIKFSVIWGVLITITFCALLLVRLGIVPRHQEQLAVTPPTPIKHSADTWMNIYQNNKKIGFSHRTFSTGSRGFHVNEDVFMQINTMGVSQALNVSTKADLNRDMTISSFTFNLTSSLFSFTARGSVVKDKLVFFTGMPGALQKSEIPLKEFPHLIGGIYDAAFRSKLAVASSRSFSIFDPSTMTSRSIKVTRNADEIISVMGKRILAQKYCAELIGAKNCIWLNKEGDALKESGLLGLSMELTSPEKARQGIAKDGVIDFSQVASVPSDVVISNTQKLNQITIKVSGLESLSPSLSGGRQKLHHGVLTISKEKTTSLPVADNTLPNAAGVFLQPTPLVQSNYPEIKEQVDRIVQAGDSPEQKTRKIISWVYRNIEKKPVLSVPNALEVLKNRVGDCNEHAVLVAALLRAAGVPAQIEAGLVYLRGRFYYHAWNIAYIGSWITADAVFNQFPADVTHIRLVRGEASEQLDLLGVMGKIKLEVITTR